MIFEKGAKEKTTQCYLQLGKKLCYLWTFNISCDCYQTVCACVHL